jgi:hypothetical protein
MAECGERSDAGRRVTLAQLATRGEHIVEIPMRHFEGLQPWQALGDSGLSPVEI